MAALGPGFKVSAAYRFAVAHGLENEAREIRSMRVHPRAQAKTGYTPRKGAFVELFESRGLINEFIDQCWSAGRTPEGLQRREAYLESKAVNDALFTGEVDDEGAGQAVADNEVPSDAELAAFAMEAQLRDFIVENISRIPIEGETLKLYRSAEGREGREFPTDVGPIDILALNEASDFFVFELKLDRGPDRALGQLARYMGWVKTHLARGREVRGVVVARSIDEKLRYAACVMPNVTLLEYEIEFRLKDVTSLAQPNPAMEPTART